LIFLIKFNAPLEEILMKRMRQITMIFLVLLVTLPFVNMIALAQDGGLPDLGGRTVTVAVENAYPPFNMLDASSGNAIGWDYDTINEICARLNCAPEFIETSWDGMIVAVGNGEFDMAADGITITEDRREIVDYSYGYAKIVQRLMVRLDEDRFSFVSEFADGDYVAGVQFGTTNYLTAQDLVGDERIVGFDQFGAAVQALTTGDVDAVVIDDVAGQGYVGENADEIRLLNDAIRSDEELGFIFVPGSDLVEPFNAALRSMVTDGSLNAINADWGLDPYSGTDLLPDLGGRTLTVAVENAYPPFNMLDSSSGAAIGWDYDTVNEICVRLNCTPEFIETSWDGMIVAVGNGEFDLAADGITITADRAEMVDYSIGYAQIIQRLMVRVGEDRFDTVDAFANGDYVVGVQFGTTNYLTAQDLVGDERIIGFDQFGAAVQALITGDVDVVVIDDVAGQGYVGENAEQISLLSDPIRSDEELGFIFVPGSDLVEPFNAALRSMVIDGSLNQINAAWGLGPFTGDLK
jgi:polar amino acid transport system substrate-binding protein